MVSYGEPQESWDSTEGHSPPRAVSTIDTALESNEEAHNSGDSSSEWEADTTLVDEESDCEIVTTLLQQKQEAFDPNIRRGDPGPSENRFHPSSKGGHNEYSRKGDANEWVCCHASEFGTGGRNFVAHTDKSVRQPQVARGRHGDKYVHVRQGELIAQAVEVETIEVPAKVQVVGTGVGTGQTESDQGVPEDLRDLFDRSKALLGSQKQEALASLLREYGMPVDSPCQDFKTDVNLATLSCGGCPYCARAQAQWSKFMTDVDDVVPLASKGKGAGLCSEWYHGRCVGISPQKAEEWENKDCICSGCKIQKSELDPPQASMNPTGLRRSARRKGSE
ncbi:KDM5 [Mytilus coruscus]|uniref:KDM5 n=1 Tax=Mytilus coruscus TaxID=42192 RepID=A0A6J8CRS7_MYTCO|nr:KDM5 [Mytilus coruscus]